MAYILSLDTTTKVCSVALSKDENVIAVAESRDLDYTHAEKLNVFIQEVVATARITIQEINAIAVAGGPGSYTGLRIGVSAAKGLCYSLSIPLVAVDPLMAMANAYISQNKWQQPTLVIPMIDARRDEVFMSIWNEQLAPIEPTSAQVLTATSFEGFHVPQIVFIGDGAAKFQAMFEGNDKIKIIPDFLSSATFIAPLAIEQFKNQKFEDVAYYEPYYGKEFQTTVSKKFSNTGK